MVARPMNLKPLIFFFAFFMAGAFLQAGVLPTTRPSGSSPSALRRPLFTNAAPVLSIRRTNYHGWPDAYIVSNPKVEVVVVPAIGRVLQFRFIGEEGVFWENCE